jgi:phospholipid/cholesterol/gamma-HCH transport system substrate-binding protein
VNTLRPEFKVGVLVVAGIVLLVLGVNYLKGFNPFAKTSSYFVVYENVSGLAVSNPVLINGYQVGQVRRIEFLQGGQGELLVEFVVEHPQLYFPSNSVAMIHSSDLFGTKAIRIEQGDSPVLAMSGDTLLDSVEDDIAAQVAKQIEPLQRKTTDLIKSVEKVINEIESIFNSEATSQLPEALESVQRTVRSLENTAANLDSTVAENRVNFGKVMSNVRSLTSTLNASSGDLTNAIENFSDVSDSLANVEFAATMARANQVLSDVSVLTSKIAAGEGSLGKLVSSDSLHNGLVTTNLELQLLLDDLQMHPWKYVQVNLIGRKPKSELSKKDLQRLEKLIDERVNSEQ